MENGVVALRTLLREQRRSEEKASGKCDGWQSMSPEHNYYSVVNLF
jgi:hypothetical protein